MATSQDTVSPAVGGHRIDALDYLKGIMIVLMISFHLVYIGDSYPYVKQMVYTFHMPVFLVISGYLMNIGKPARRFLLTLFWLAVPYVVMESGYILAAAQLPIREHIEVLTTRVFFDRLFLHPLGPYWYLHTLLLCGLTYYTVFRLHCLSLLSRYIVTALLFALYAWLGLLSLPLALYFLAGGVVRQSGLTFLQVFRPSLWAFVALGWLFAMPANLHPGVAGGVLIVYLVVSGLLALYPYLGKGLQRGVTYLGRNTLSLFLFSPVFTILCKSLVPYLSFDPTGMLFLLLSLILCIGGSLCLRAVLDRCGVSPYFFGPKR